MLAEFLGATLIHGFGYILLSKRLIEKLCWVGIPFEKRMFTLITFK